MANRFWLLEGDLRKRLLLLPDNHIQVCMTSPPYFGLRLYGKQADMMKYYCVWNAQYADGRCIGWENGREHIWTEVKTQLMMGGTGSASKKQLTNAGTQFGNDLDDPLVTYICSECQAWYGPLGMEPTPEMYVEHMVEAVEALRPKLKRDGILFLNLGDSYAGSGKGPTGHNGIGDQEVRQGFRSRAAPKAPPGYKPKDLFGVPWMVALALQKAGWWLRSDIIWSKPNPFPESVRDRPSRAHEYVFMLTRSQRYYYDYEAIQEPKIHVVPGENPMRNKRDVWEIPTQPYPGHKAVFPEALVEPCIKAGSRPGDVAADIFLGSGTTGAVALRLGRDFVGFELVPEYVGTARRRMLSTAPDATDFSLQDF